MALQKLLILSSTGGYGHIAAAKTLIQLSKGKYDADVVYLINELRMCGVPSGESLYNIALSNNWTRLINFGVRIFPPLLFPPREKKIACLIEKHIQEKKPDILISLIPFVNYPASEAARRSNIPFLMITTDNDLHNWVFELQKRKYENIKVTIGTNLPTTRGTLIRKGIPEEVIETIGLPLRPNFLTTKSKRELLKEYNVPKGKPIVLIMMGGTGAGSIVQYTKSIGQSKLGVHLLVCTGRKKRLPKKLKKIKLQSGNSLDVIPFTEKIEELFALADLIITKPGPGSINEAFAFKLPILIDRTTPPLYWEQANIDLVLLNKVGACIKSLSEVPAQVKRFLFDEQLREEIARSYEKLAPNTFGERIYPLIEEMCSNETAAAQPAKLQ